MDALILFGWLVLAAVTLRRHGHLGGAGWRTWLRLRDPYSDNADVRLVRGLPALSRMDDLADRLGADRGFAADIASLAEFSNEEIDGAVERGLGRWRAQTPLLNITFPVRPLAAWGPRDGGVRFVAALEAALARVPAGRWQPLVLLRRHLLALRVAALLVRRRLQHLERARGAAHAAALRAEHARLVQAAMAAHDVLLRSLLARHEEIYGARH